MKVEEIKIKVIEALKELEESGDIVITTALPDAVVNKVVEALGCSALSLLSDDEYRAVVNSLNVLSHDVNLDNRNFQTIIGIEKEDLKIVSDKLNRFS